MSHLLHTSGDSTMHARDENPVNPANPPHLATRILVVDDDSDTLKISSKALIHSGYKVHTAKDGAAGWDALLAAQYGLLVTDNQMPMVSGVELIRKVRRAQMPLPVILATGTPPFHTEDLQLAALLQKPFTQDELIKTVKAALQWQMSGDAADKVQQLAARLLAYEAALLKAAGTKAFAASRVCERARGPFSELTGVEAYRSLLVRALAVAGAEVPWVLDIQIKVDGSLHRFHELRATTNRESFASGEAALVTQLLRLLAVLIGPAITLTLVRSIWPKLDDLTF